MKITGLSRRCVQGWCRWLERRGLLAVLEPGTTPRYRPGILCQAGNLAREWLLTAPSAAVSGDRTCTPPRVLDLRKDLPAPMRARARQTPGQGQAQMDRRSAPDSTPPPSRQPAPAPPWPPGKNPQRRRDALAACEQLRAGSGRLVLHRLSGRALRSALRPWFRSGWTPADVLWALEHSPDGRQHQHAARVRVPARWLAARLAHWLRPDGAPLPPHSAELAVRAERGRAQRWTGAAPRQDQSAAAARARAMLEARLAELGEARGPARPRIPSRTALPTPPLPAAPATRPRSARGRPARPG